MSKARGSTFGLVADVRWAHGVFAQDKAVAVLPFIGWATEVVSLEGREEETEIVPIFLFGEHAVSSRLLISEDLHLTALVLREQHPESKA